MSPDLLLTRDLILRPPGVPDQSAFTDLIALSGQQPKTGHENFQDLLAHGGMQLLLLETKTGQELVGHLDWRKPNRPFLEILPGCRLRSYATQALDRVSRYRDDLSEIRMEIDSSNPAARSLLEKCGYQCISGSSGANSQYSINPQPQRKEVLEILDAQYHQALESELLALHQELQISPVYAHQHQLEISQEATELSDIGTDIYGRKQYLTPAAARAWNNLLEAATEEGEELQPVSAYRGIPYQASIVRRKLDRGIPITEILKISAAPGHSEHHTGNAIDITTPGSATLEEEFENTSAFAWLTNNASQYGFLMSYPRNNKHQIAYEPWHWAFDAKRMNKP